MNTKTETDRQIDEMRPGETLMLGTRTWVERSGDGKTLTFVRRSEDGNTEAVFHKCRF